ncbi:MAG: hypothetical protein A2521_17045 [Deltaproteobacteria bacterium RIFOXYD12_FULL_57_12]|nr:MAG: hypothetical protein A2521_17045 [Deltaproteobacteria bacterium RIFOXYD12_FULL_57_12]
MTSKKANKKPRGKHTAEQSEQAMIEGILEGSPDALGVAVIRYNCGCRKMAAVDKTGEAASKIIMYRDLAISICDLCKEDNGAYTRITAYFMHWVTPEPKADTKTMIETKVFGSRSH